MSEERGRARDFGIPLTGEPGEWNAITDVPGVEVGYVTLVEGDDVRTGVTALLPRGRDGVGTPCAAGWHSLNGNGEMTGTAWLEESGALAVPVLLTNTYAVGPVHRGVVEWVRRHRRDIAPEWLLPVVTETWDGYLHDIHGAHVTPAHAGAAIDAAAGGPVAEGGVGGGTGMRCYGWKGGSGTASRVVRYGAERYTVGVFVQANFGARRELVVAGTPLGRAAVEAAETAEAEAAEAAPEGGGGRGGTGAGGGPGAERPLPPGAGSVIVVVATDAPLLPGQCKALARRVPLGLARTGTTGSHFSGDLFLAFSTANPSALTSTFPPRPAADGDAGGAGDDAPYETLRFIPWGRVDPFHTAVVEAVEEAVLNVLTAAGPMTGRDGHHVPAFPLAALAGLRGARTD
ncbi:aminopeptidase [Streptomyces sp. WAC 06738]|uniref:P1 family peptidase n=1 Tax=Streptomyces sp. WAC 06738 TaxID=2203210 RepID=UPI000F7019B7|nr:P1 family peptidase [Streptomyces sp. WAC 06738]AZM47190.1 aminopeptidase [Streptomyces sp. WAC 06738]